MFMKWLILGRQRQATNHLGWVHCWLHRQWHQPQFDRKRVTSGYVITIHNCTRCRLGSRYLYYFWVPSLAPTHNVSEPT
jgi:hypothetical protein